MYNINFDKIISDILADFYATFDLKPVNVRYLFVDDMVEAYKDIRPEYAELHPEVVADANRYNGLTVMPIAMDEPFDVLVDINKMLSYIKQKNMTWVGTVAHETTHVIDYSKYAKLIGAASYDEIQDISKHSMFLLWSEFNARSKGYYFVRKYTFDNMTDENQVKDIVEYELPTLQNRLYKEYHGTDDGYMQAYLVVQYIGRLYTLHQLFPKHIDDDFIKFHLAPNIWMYKWYKFLSEHTNLEDAYKEFDKMKNILSDNFRGL